MELSNVTQLRATSRALPSAEKSPPPLVAGDRLTRHEFRRRYEAMPHVKKAELIEGVVYMPSPVGHELHGSPHFDFLTWLGVYRANTPGVDGGDNSTVRLRIGENEPQPDGFLRILPSHGGQTRNVKGYVEGSPELMAEITASSASYDLHDKRLAYQRNGAREYVVWRTLEKAIDWFVLRDGVFQSLAADKSGVFKSLVFPGLWLDTKAMLRGNMARVLQTLERGLDTPQHAAFVRALRHSAQKEKKKKRRR
jgi:Uma2 family endonuclease